MSDTTSSGSASDTTTEGTPAAADTAVTVPDGYVPKADLDREIERARGFQREADRLKAAAAKPATTEPSAAGEKGFDPDAYRAGLLKEVIGASQLATAVPSIRTEFPHADAGLFDPDVLSEFGDVESLRAAAEADHNRVAALVKAETEKIEAKLREEFGTAAGDAGAGPGATKTQAGGTPTAAQVNAMSIAELAALDVSHPGLAEKVALGQHA